MPYDGVGESGTAAPGMAPELPADLLHLLRPGGPLPPEVRLAIRAALSAIRQPPRTGVLAEWQKTRLCRFIAAHIGADLPQAVLAAEVRLSVSHFARTFRRSFGCTPHRYVMARRMERARVLLCSTDQPISAIALGCGLSDQAHLSRLFKQETGLTPSQWRRCHAACA